MDIVTPSIELHDFTVADMHRFAVEAWGPIGTAIVDKWVEFNGIYFGGVLKPVPLVITNTLPFGKRLAFCSYGGPHSPGRTITLNIPKDHCRLLADNNTLLHEMLHQYLFERGEYPSHDGEPWRREIMRLTKVITGREIWAGPSVTVRRDCKVVRINKDKGDGTPSLPQAVIARWPHDELDIDFGQIKCRG
jgi:hypothetical protein